MLRVRSADELLLVKSSMLEKPLLNFCKSESNSSALSKTDVPFAADLVEMRLDLAVGMFADMLAHTYSKDELLNMAPERIFDLDCLERECDEDKYVLKPEIATELQDPKYTAYNIARAWAIGWLSFELERTDDAYSEFADAFIRQLLDDATLRVFAEKNMDEDTYDRLF